MDSMARVVWFTGMPNAGKTTISCLVAQWLEQQGQQVELLDGNELREWLSSGLGFEPEDRSIHAMRVAKLANLLVNHNVWCLVAVIAPYREIQEKIKDLLGGKLDVVFLQCPVDILAARDKKDLYRKAMAGEIDNFTGITDRYDEPLEPTLTLDSKKQGAEQIAEKVIEMVRAKMV